MYEVHKHRGVSYRVVFCFDRRSIVGGSWFSGARDCCSAIRYGIRLDDRAGDLGFRVIHEVDKL